MTARFRAMTATLLESGINPWIPAVDTSSVPEKLASQGRVIDLATMTVTTPVPDAEAIPGTQPQPQDT